MFLVQSDRRKTTTVLSLPNRYLRDIRLKKCGTFRKIFGIRSKSEWNMYDMHFVGRGKINASIYSYCSCR